MMRVFLVKKHGASGTHRVAGFSSLVFLFAILAVLLSTFCHLADAQTRDKKRVLLLFSEYGQRGGFLEPFELSVRTHTWADITFEQSYLEGPHRLDEKSYQDSAAETLYRRFAGEKLDLVVPVGPSALLFTVQYRDRIFPGVPVVFAGVSSDQFAGKTWPGITGVIHHVGLGETIDLALRLQPDTTTVAVISPYDPPWLAITHTELSRYKGRVSEKYLVGPPGPELFEKVAALPPHAIVLFDLALAESGQPPLTGFDLLDAVAQRIPTFSPWPNLCLNHGCIGGAFEESPKIIQQAAGLAAKVLSGVPVDKIPISQIAGLQVRVDSRALQHWHIPESALPPGTQVLFREPTVWEQGRKYFLSGIAVIAAQALLIFTLFWERSRRRKAEIQVARSEEKFSKAFRRSPLSITIVSAIDDRYIDVNEAFEIHTGWKRDEVIGRTPQELNIWMYPEQRSSFVRQLANQTNAKEMEFRFRRKDGQIRTALKSAELIDVNGERCVLSVIVDISERKQAEEAIAGFSRKLIEAQEKERTRIARELHDDINQRLAMVAVGLKMAMRYLSAAESRPGSILEETCARVTQLEIDIQDLSHRLHSSKLEYLGLDAAASSFCKELSKLHDVSIQFRSDGVPENLSAGVSLCLYRVLQEALHNAAKYSGVSDFEVSLTCASNAIELKVHDSGIGFDPKRIRNEQGLGLTSMNERLKMVNGVLSIDSRPGNGTTVVARVPLVEEVEPLLEAMASSDAS